ncbi:MAG: N-acetylmuramoyl-L-alanine amidase, partial [Alphaproteobacteria bacterium]|nr:N-acetylmuramoyl-L-alanine amidase [Alphaproteobacteria bacterium]
MILALVSAAGLLPALAEAEPNSSPASNPASAPLRPSMSGLAISGPAISGLATGGAELPIIHAVARSASGKGVRLEFSVTGQAEPKAFVLADPDRVIVDLPETIFRITAQGGARAGGPAGDFRFGLVSQGRSRIVIDLTRPARIAAARYEALADNAGRIVLELEAVGRERFMELARAGQAAGGAIAPGEAKGRAAPARSAGRSPGVVVVIDPGHGGIDSGAVGASRIPEKDITLSFARTLAEKLNATGRYEAILTRDGDVFVPLGER